MKVGLLHPRVGAAGIWAPSLDAAATLGAAEINAAGGILGEEIELVFADCGLTVGEAIDAVDTLIDLDRADVIIGGHPSNLRDAVSERVSGKAPYIYTAQFEGVACGPSTVAIGSTDRELMAPALHWLSEGMRAERFFFVGTDYIWPRMAFAATQRLVRDMGGRLVDHCFLSDRFIPDPDVLKRIARSGAHVVIQALVGQCAIDFNRAFAAAGLDQKILRFGLLVDETVMCGIGSEASANLFTSAHYFANWHSRQNDAFLERYHDAFGEWAPPVSAASVGCYEAFHVLAEMARRLGSRKGGDLARRLDDRSFRPAARNLLREKPVGRSPRVQLGAAEGATIRVIAEFAA